MPVLLSWNCNTVLRSTLVQVEAIFNAARKIHHMAIIRVVSNCTLVFALELAGIRAELVGF